jgi:hypothetical protein
MSWLPARAVDSHPLAGSVFPCWSPPRAMARRWLRPLTVSAPAGLYGDRSDCCEKAPLRSVGDRRFPSTAGTFGGGACAGMGQQACRGRIVAQTPHFMANLCCAEFNGSDYGKSALRRVWSTPTILRSPNSFCHPRRAQCNSYPPQDNYARRLIFAAMMKSFSWRPFIFFVRSDTVT